jgi:hypothetical protein
MKDNEKEISEGLNQIFEIINAKGDVGELKEIVNKNEEDTNDEMDNIFTIV